MSPRINQDTTVYSTESGRHCSKCGKPISQCTCKQIVHLIGNGVIRVSRESKGRKGKTVTLISGIALNDEAIHSLLSSLKRICGAGGAIKEGVIEIQGDHRETVIDELKKRNFKVKIIGG